MAGTRTTTTLPHNTQENGIAERSNRTLINGIRCILATAKLPVEYWPNSTMYVTFKHTLMLHHCTGLIPFTQQHNTTIYKPKLLKFGRLGYVPERPTQGKITYRSVFSRYVRMYDLKTIIVQFPDVKNRRCRHLNFHSIHKHITQPPPKLQSSAHLVTV